LISFLNKFIVLFTFILVGCRENQDTKYFNYVDINKGSVTQVGAKCIADLNGDGKPDLIVSGYRSGGLVWFENPSWEKHIITSKRKYRTEIEVNDIDGDGDLDVFALLRDSLLWYENGMEWKQHLVNAGTVLHDIELVDLDKDSLVDIVARDQNFPKHVGDTLYIFKQKSLFNWILHKENITDGEGLKVADMDGDNLPDVIVNQYWFQNTGEITHWIPHRFTTSWVHLSTFIDVADINGDGFLDIIMAPAEQKGQQYRLSWFESPLPEISQSNWQEHIVEDNIEAVRHYVGTADMNKDGQFDILSAEMSQGHDPDEIIVYLNQENSKHWKRLVIGTEGSHSMRVGDINNDGWLDLFGGDWDGEIVQLWLNTGNWN